MYINLIINLDKSNNSLQIYIISIPSTEGKNKIVAALLALFLGCFGIHKFYLGKIDMGILYLLFFGTLIPSIVSFFEGIIYLSTSDENFKRKYG